MHHNSFDTIAAIASPPGRGGVGIVRVSGANVPTIALKILGSLPKPRYAIYSSFLNEDGTAIEQGIALFFPAPHSFTGEDVIEFHCHGSPIILDILLQQILGVGARVARPGEFSERAFLHGKIDLTQAEAIADLIDCGSREAARAAMRSLQGEFSRQINTLLASLIKLRIYVEAAIDFPEEEIDFLTKGGVAAALIALINGLDTILTTAKQGQILQEGMSIVILGKPNAGKSSLLNRLSGTDSAIVTEIPGTTRDVLREFININGVPLHIVDTAGLRDPGDPIEREGIRRAQQEATKAHHLLWVIDAQTITTYQEAVDQLQAHNSWLKDDSITMILNKSDLTKFPVGKVQVGNKAIVTLSAMTGEGLPTLRNHLQNLMGYDPSCEGIYLARRRHIDALQRTKLALMQGIEQLETYKASELLAEDLRSAQNSLAEITGEFSSQDLLNTIFSSFCIGK